MKYNDLDFVVVWSSIKEMADSTASRPGQTITSESLNRFANKVLEAFPEEFIKRMEILERDIEKESKNEER